MLNFAPYFIFTPFSTLFSPLNVTANLGPAEANLLQKI